MSIIKKFDLSSVKLRAFVNNKTYAHNPEAPVGCVTRVEGSKLNYLILSKIGDDLYLLATTLKKTLETRFMIGGGARNDNYHTTTQLNRHNVALKRFVPVRKRLPEFIKSVNFKVNNTRKYIVTDDFKIFLEVFRATRFPEQTDKKIDEWLLEVYEQSNKAYHQGIEETNLSDKTFDGLRTYLVDQGLVDSTKTGAEPVATSKKVNLDTPLGSLENAFTLAELIKWFSKYPNSEELVQTPKIDGISGQVNYVRGILKSGNTKGDGFIGEDITALVKLIPGIPKNLRKPVTVSIRCELFIKNSVFNKKYGKNSGRDKPFKNPRNMMAGQKNRKHPDQQIVKDISVLGYAILDSNSNKVDQLNTIAQLGFPVVSYDVIKVSELKKSDKLFQEYRAANDYDMDGAVVEVNKANLREGFVGSGINPRYAVAFKPDTQKIQTTVKSVKWAISKDRYAKPTAVVEPVDITGVTISAVTLHNAKKVRDLKLGPGAIVEIQRSGDAIPHILRTIKPAKVLGLPKPGEWGGWSWNSTDVDIILNDGVHSDEHEIEKIITFFSALNVERFSEGLIKAFYNHGFKTIPAILHMTQAQIIKEVPRQGDTSAKNIITEFSKLKNPGVDLPSLMYASGCFGRGLGKLKFKDLYAEYGDELLSGWSGMRLDDIAASIDELPGFSYETGKQFALGIKPYISFYKSVKDVIYVKSKETRTGKLNGEIICFTGFRDAALVKRITTLGGDYVDSVSRKTTILVLGGAPSEKSKKAEAKGIRIMSRAEFEKLVK